MKKMFKTISIIAMAVLLSNCVSKVIVTKSWKSDFFSEVDNQKILVITRFKNEAIRQRSEHEIVLKLREMGIDANEAFVAFPYLNVNIHRQNEEVEALISSFIEKGYGAVIITEAKNQKENNSGETRLTETNEQVAPFVFNGDNPATLETYFNYSASTAPNRTPGPNGMEETTVNFSEVFHLETLTYSIKKNSEQILSSQSITVTDPDELKKIMASYAQKIAKQF